MQTPTDTTADLDKATPDVAPTNDTTNDAPTAPAPSEASAPKSLRDSIVNALEKQVAAKPADVPATSTAKPTDAPAAPAPAPAATDGKTIDPITGREVEPIKVPGGIRPELRDKWTSLSPDWQKHISEREKSISQLLNSTTDDRKFAKEMRDVVSPHEDVLRASGITAAQHINVLMNMSRALHLGDPHQRARVIVDLMKSFKPDGNTMSALLNGQQANIPPVAKPAPSREQIADEVLRERESKESEQTMQQALSSFEADTANEWYENVRVQMGKIISAGLVEMPDAATALKNAYDMAVKNDASIQSVLSQRQAASAPAPAPAPTQQPLPRSAKPSLGAGKATPGPARKMTSTQAAQAAWDALNAT